MLVNLLAREICLRYRTNVMGATWRIRLNSHDHVCDTLPLPKFLTRVFHGPGLGLDKVAVAVDFGLCRMKDESS